MDLIPPLPDGDGVTVFIALTDTPNSYVGNAEKYLRVNSGENAVEFTTLPAYQPLAAGLTSLAGLTYVAASFVKMTGVNTFALRTIAQTKADLSLNLVENTTLSTWTGSGNITTLGTISSGVWQSTDVGIAYGGTGKSTAQAAINALSDVSGATNEHVLTKDTATGNAIFKAATGGGAGFSSRCRVTLGTEQTIATGTITQANFDTEQYDNDGEWASYHFTAAEAGNYLITYCISFFALADGDSCYGLIYKNGANTGCTCRNAASATMSIYSPGTDILELDANDTIDIRVLHDYGANRVMQVPASLQFNFVAIHRLS